MKKAAKARKRAKKSGIKDLEAKADPKGGINFAGANLAMDKTRSVGNDSGGRGINVSKEPAY